MESWLPVVGYEGLYEVSNQGRVRSLTRIVFKSNGRRQTVHGRILKAYNQNGYIIVHLRTNQVDVKAGVHRLVCEAFNGPALPGQVTRHRDGTRNNNVPNNLCWGFPVDNTQDMIAHGRHVQARKTHCPCGKPYDITEFEQGKQHRRCATCKRYYSRLRQKRYRDRKRQACAV
jgi:hypothetical protein